MSASTSPSHYEDFFITDINQKMKVPDKLSFNPDLSGITRDNWTKDNIDMHVPERILVAGHQQHVGTRAPPREIVYDKSILATDPYPGDIRVATPPRTLTLDKYPFPEFEDSAQEDEETVSVRKSKLNHALNQTDLLINHRESTPPIGAGGDSLTSSDEVLHLRKQMAKLNRRIMALEMDNLNRLQREKFVLGFGVAYFLFKFVIWMNKD